MEQLRAWRRGARNFIIVGAIALALAAALALWVEKRVAIPLCQSHGAAQKLIWQRYDTPSRLSNDFTSVCIYRDQAGHEKRVRFSTIAPHWWTDMLVNFALEIELTAIFFFILVALIAALFGRLVGGGEKGSGRR